MRRASTIGLAAVVLIACGSSEGTLGDAGAGSDAARMDAAVDAQPSSDAGTAGFDPVLDQKLRSDLAAALGPSGSSGALLSVQLPGKPLWVGAAGLADTQ